MPHSRFNEVRRDEIEAAGLSVLVDSPAAGVHLAVSADQSGIVYFQGHPEYDADSLLKEYKREVLRYLRGEIGSPPPYPENYLSADAQRLLGRHLDSALAAEKRGGPVPSFPEDELVLHLERSWGDASQAIFNNWLGIVGRMARSGRRASCMQGTAPQGTAPKSHGMTDRRS